MGDGKGGERNYGMVSEGMVGEKSLLSGSHNHSRKNNRKKKKNNNGGKRLRKILFGRFDQMQGQCAEKGGKVTKKKSQGKQKCGKKRLPNLWKPWGFLMASLCCPQEGGGKTKNLKVWRKAPKQWTKPWAHTNPENKSGLVGLKTNRQTNSKCSTA